MRHVLARVDAHIIAIPAEQVTEMQPMPPVSQAPGMPAMVRGVLRARGRTLPLVCLRRVFGRPAAADAAQSMIEMLRARRQDHEKWIGELEASIRDRRPFTLTTDPHACGFGVWYDAFRTDDVVLSAHMRRFDAPHKAIHGLAREVLTRAGGGDVEGALHAVTLARGSTLKKLVHLFQSAESLVRAAHEEIAVLVHAPNPFAVAVDQVDALVDFPSASIEAAGSADRSTGLVGYAHAADGRTILVVDLLRVADGAGVGAVAA